MVVSKNLQASKCEQKRVAINDDFANKMKSLTWSQVYELSKQT